MKSEVLVDVWFQFGSVSYGLECALRSCNTFSASLSPLFESQKESASAKAFFDELVSTSQELRKIELRVFHENALSAPRNLEFPIVMHSENLPALSIHSEMHWELKLVNLKALGSRDESNWTQFVDWFSKNLLN